MTNTVSANIKVAIVLPAYNEEQTIAATIEDFHQALPDAAIWVINNRSSDATEHKALATLSRHGCKGGLSMKIDLARVTRYGVHFWTSTRTFIFLPMLI